MSAIPEVSQKDALKYYLQHADKIDIAQLVKNFAITQPQQFLEFLEEVTQITPALLGGKIAKAMPAKFLELCSEEYSEYEACDIILTFMKANPMQKVPAIKKVRETWGLGLKEAKDVIDVLHHSLGVAGFTTPYNFTHPNLDEKQRKIFDKLKGRMYG